MSPVSSRFGIDYPLGTEAPDIDGDILKVVQGIEALAAQFGQGTLAARPPSSPGSPGKQGRIYVVTSGAELGQIHYDYGTGWIWLNNIPSIGANSITATELAADSVGNSEMQDNAVGSAEIIDGSVGTAEIANALKPSTGAGAGTEALRALGTGAGNAAAGNDARFTDARPPTDNSVSTVKIQDGAVTGPKLAGNSVAAANIVDGSVGNAELGADAVTAAKILDGSVGAAEIADLSVGTAELGNYVVTAVKANVWDTWNFLGILQNHSMRLQRHPYAFDSHTEWGQVGVGQGTMDNGTTYEYGVTFTDPFAHTISPIVGANTDAGIICPSYRDLTGSGMIVRVYNNNQGQVLAAVTWAVFGGD
jgi:hypothetical protein